MKYLQNIGWKYHPRLSNLARDFTLVHKYYAKNSINIFLILGFFMVFMFFSVSIPIQASQEAYFFAQEETENQEPTNDTNEVFENSGNVESFSGEIVRIDNREISVEGEGEVIRTFTIPTGIEIQENGIDREFSQLSPGDQVTVEYSSDGRVFRVETVSEEVINWAIITVGALILAIIIGLLAYYAYKRSRQGHIKTGSVS